MKEGERFCSQCGFDNEQPKEPHHLPPRSILAGKYLVGKVLGEGGFGITYLGFDLNLNIKVAIKEYFPSGFVTRTGGGTTVTPFTGSSAEYYSNGIEKFLNEARSLARFHNLDGIVEVRDFFRENGTAYIVMEFVDGVNLRDELERRGGRMDANEVMALMQPLVASLVKVHNTGLVHRDISPDNIMLTPEGKLKLLDFGAARDAAANKSVSVVLKPGYAPEEQYRTHGELGAWTDIYALCGTIYKLITGITPPESIERLTNDTLAHPARLSISINAMQSDAIMKGLSVHKEGRFGSTAELYDALYSDAGRLNTVLPKPVQGGGTFAPQVGTYAPQSGTSFTPPYTPQGSGYAPSQQIQSGTPTGFKKLWAEKKGLLIAGMGGAALLVVLLVVLLTGNKGKPTGGEVFNSPSAPMPTATSTLPAIVATPAPVATSSTEDVSLSFTDPGQFFEQKPTTNEIAEGTEYTYWGMDWHGILNYLAILENEGYNVTVIGDDTTLFTVSDAQTTISFKLGADDSSITMVCPSNVTLNLTDTPVTEHYLNNNGITAEQWIALGASDYYGYSSYNYMGSSNGNVQNTCEAAMQGNRLYIADNNNSLGIFALDIESGDVVAQLTNDSRDLYYLNVAGDYLYYCAVENGGDNEILYYAYRTKTDGSEQPEPLLDNAKNIVVYGDYLYYVDTVTKALKRMNTYTCEIEDVLVNAGYFMNISDDRIFCADSGDSTGIYSYALDGSDEKRVIDADCYNMVVSGGWIYYLTSENDGSQIRRVDIEGDNDQLVVSDKVHSFNVIASCVYYSTGEEYALKCLNLLNLDTTDILDYGKYPTLVESASNLILFTTDENGKLNIYDYDDGTATVIDLS
jgi:serine/threonine protein kinase